MLLFPMIARGEMLGPNQPVILCLFDTEPAAETLSGVKIKLTDVAFPLLKGVDATTNVIKAWTDVDIALMIGGFPRKDGMERKDVISKIESIYKAQSSALEQHASSNCKDSRFMYLWNCKDYLDKASKIILATTVTGLVKSWLKNLHDDLEKRDVGSCNGLKKMSHVALKMQMRACLFDINIGYNILF